MLFHVSPQLVKQSYDVCVSGEGTTCPPVKTQVVSELQPAQSQTTGLHLYFILCKHFNDYFLEHTHLKISVYLKLQLELNKCL